MFSKPCPKQKKSKPKIKSYACTEHYRVGLGMLTISQTHLNNIYYIAKQSKHSQSCVIEKIIKYTLVHNRVDPVEIIRLRSVPCSDGVYKKFRFTISKEIKALLYLKKEKYQTRLSVVLWHIFNLFFENHCPLHLLLTEDLDH